MGAGHGYDADQDRIAGPGFRFKLEAKFGSRNPFLEQFFAGSARVVRIPRGENIRPIEWRFVARRGGEPAR